MLQIDSAVNLFGLEMFIQSHLLEGHRTAPLDLRDPFSSSGNMRKSISTLSKSESPASSPFVIPLWLLFYECTNFSCADLMSNSPWSQNTSGSANGESKKPPIPLTVRGNLTWRGNEYVKPLQLSWSMLSTITFPATTCHARNIKFHVGQREVIVTLQNYTNDIPILANYICSYRGDIFNLFILHVRK